MIAFFGILFALLAVNAIVMIFSVNVADKWFRTTPPPPPPPPAHPKPKQKKQHNGGLGSVLRYAIAKPLNHLFQNFFLGTFAVNVVGCLLMGIVLGISTKNNMLSSNSTLFLATGFCGGFTTFSAFALEKHSLLKNGELFHFCLYTIASIVIGIIAVALGLWLSKIGD